MAQRGAEPARHHRRVGASDRTALHVPNGIDLMKDANQPARLTTSGDRSLGKTQRTELAVVDVAISTGRV
jgi:hypothetical protein